MQDVLFASHWLVCRKRLLDAWNRVSEYFLDPLRGGVHKDFYTSMFIFDLLTFLITVFGWSSFAVSQC